MFLRRGSLARVQIDQLSMHRIRSSGGRGGRAGSISLGGAGMAFLCRNNEKFSAAPYAVTSDSIFDVAAAKTSCMHFTVGTH